MKTFKQLCFALTFGISAAFVVVAVIYFAELI
jgi:hypothetical protein